MEYPATSQQSSYSSLISDYVFESINEIEPNSNFVESIEEVEKDEERHYNPSPIMEEEGEDEGHNSESDRGPFSYNNNNSSGSSPDKNEDSVPGDEDIDESSSHRNPKHNSPQQSFRVFRQ